MTFDDGRKAFADRLSAATIKDLGAKPVEQKCFQRTKTVFIFLGERYFLFIIQKIGERRPIFSTENGRGV